MGLQAVYERFIASPRQQNLADSATLHYVTTLTSFTKPGPIIQHLENQNNNIVKKKSEKVISAVEGLTSVAVIVETTLQFEASGGAYLPGLDSFIIDRIATLPVTHFVHFDQNDQITQIRLSWDQGDLLKQIEVIGTRGRNWPVYAGKDQIKIISASTSVHNETNPAPKLSPRGRRNGNERSASPSKKYIKDPHTSLDLYQHQEEERQPSAPNAVGPRASAKPAPREMNELFAAGHEDFQAGPGGSPKKVVNENVVAPKGAGHKKFQPSRIWDEEGDVAPKETKIYKTNPARYDHFDIGDAYDDSFQHLSQGKHPVDMPIRASRKQGAHQASQWDFEDFATPEKVKQKVRDQDVVHFSMGDEQKSQENVAPKAEQAKGRKAQEAHFEMKDAGTPVHRPNVPKPRHDAETHFNFTDEPTPAPRRIIARTKQASQLYADPVFGGEEEAPLGNISNQGQRKNFGNHFDMNDELPENAKLTKPVGGRTRNVKRDQETHWDF